MKRFHILHLHHYICMFKTKYEYPLNHPEIYLEEECLNVNVTSIFGLIQCCILHPSTLLFPVLTLMH